MEYTRREYSRKALTKYTGEEGLLRYSQLICELMNTRFTIPKRIVNETRWGFLDACFNEDYYSFFDVMVLSVQNIAEMEYSNKEVAMGEYEKLFWTLLNNMRLDMYDDENFDKYEVRMKLINMNIREFDPSGCGWLFRFRTSGVDCREWNMRRQWNSFAIEFYNPTLTDDSPIAKQLRADESED